MISIEGTLRLQLCINVKSVDVAPLFTSRSQHSGESLVAVSKNRMKRDMFVKIWNALFAPDQYRL